MNPGIRFRSLFLTWLVALALSGEVAGQGTNEVVYPLAAAEQQQALSDWLAATRAGRGSSEALSALERASSQEGQARIGSLQQAIKFCQRDQDGTGLGLVALLLTLFTPPGTLEHQEACRLALQYLEPGRKHLRALTAYRASAELIGLARYADAARILSDGLEQSGDITLDARLEGDMRLSLAMALAWSGSAQAAEENLGLARQRYQAISFEPGLINVESAHIDLLKLRKAESQALEAAERLKPRLSPPAYRELRLRNDLIIAGLLFIEGRLNEALALTRQTLSESRTQPALPRTEVESLTLLSTLLLARGADEEAELTMREVIESTPQVRSFIPRYQLAQLYIGHGRLSRAEELLTGALEICRQQQAPAWSQIVEYSLATTLWEQGKLEQSLPHYEELLRQLLPEGPTRLQGNKWINLALSAWKRGDHQAALVAYESLLDLIRESGSSWEAGNLYGDLSTVYRKLGIADREQACLERALACQQSSQNPLDSAANLARLADLEMALGRLGPARSRVEELERRLGDRPIRKFQAEFLALKGRLLAAEGRESEAEACWLEAMRLFESIQSQALYSGGEISALGASASLIATSNRLVQVMLAQNRVQDAWRELERARARLFRAVCFRYQSVGAGDGPTRARLEKLYSQLAHAEGMDRSNPTPQRRQELADLRQKIQDAETVLDRQSRAIDNLAPPDLEAVLRAIPPETGVLQYLILENQAWAFVLTRDEITLHRLEFAGETELAPRVDALRRALVRDLTSPPTGQLQALSGNLILPVESRLEGLTRLFIVQHGSLCLVPFESLPDSQGQILLDRFPISYLESSREPISRPSALKPARALVMGGPDYTLARPATAPRSSLRDGGRRDWGPLPGALKEATEIAALLNARALLADKASESNFKQQAGQADLIHIATHGYMDDPSPPLTHPLLASATAARATDLPVGWTSERNPLSLCGLAFAGVNKDGDGQEDGDLTGLEVLPLDLSRAQLVVLSACVTARGELHSTEGVYGLRRAFRVAGARALVLSLWKVDDEATRELMVAFYKNLLSGEDPALALQHAKQSVLARPGYAHPFYWAAFQLVGG